MSDAPFMISPAGFIVDYNFGAPGTGVVTRPLPGATVQLVGGGQYNLAGQLGGARGAIQADLVTGAAGSAQGVAAIVGGVNPTTTYLSISLDTQNRPTFAITDALGVVKAQGSPSGSAIPSGVVFSIILAWDATGSVSFTVGSVPQAVVVAGPWASFAPVAVLYGAAGTGVPGLGVLVGRLNKVQISNSGGLAVPVVTYGTEYENVVLRGAASVSATAKALHKVQAALQGVASVTAVRS